MTTNNTGYKLNIKRGWIIPDNCTLVKGTITPPFSSIGNHAIISSDCIIGSHSRINNNVTIDVNCNIKKNTIIGNDCSIADGAHLGNNVVIGDDCLLGDFTQGFNVVFGDDCIIENDNEIKHQVIGIRLFGDDNYYYESEFKKYTNHLDSNKIKRVEFGKQDQRSAYSVTTFNHKGAIDKQIAFVKKDQLLGFVVGYNQAVFDHKQ